MTDDPRDNIHGYRREKLEPEIAAMSVETDDDDNPVVIVNIDDPDAKNAIKKVITWVGGILGIGAMAEWVRQSMRRQLTLAIAGTAAVATTTTAVVTEAFVQERSDPQPPATAMQVVTLPPAPPVTVTATPQPPRPSKTRSAPPRERSRPRLTPTAERPQAAPTVAAPPPQRPARTRPQPTRPARTKRATTPPPTPTRTQQPTQPQGTGADQAGTDASLPTASSPPPATAGPTRPAPEPQPEPSPTVPEPPVAAARNCDGLLEVNLDPLLDLCLLG